MNRQHSVLHQTLYKTAHPPISLIQCRECELETRYVNDFLATATGALGVAVSLGSQCIIDTIAFSTPTRVLCVSFTRSSMQRSQKKKKKKIIQQDVLISSGRDVLYHSILGNTNYRKNAFDMHRVAAALFLDYGLTIVQAVDLQSAVSKDRQALDTLLQILGGPTRLNRERVLDVFKGASFDTGSVENAALRAWACCQVDVAGHLKKSLSRVPVIDTSGFNLEHLALIASFIRDADRLYALKPTKVKNDVRTQFSQKNDHIRLDMTRFKTRLRSSQYQQIRINFATKTSAVSTSVSGRAIKAEGKTAHVLLNLNKVAVANSTIRSIHTIGREDPTPAEAKRDRILLAAIQREVSLFSIPFAKAIFLTNKPPALSPVASAPIFLAGRQLNPSQQFAVQHIISKQAEHRICLIHGPPGTGKTSVIAATVLKMMEIPDKKQGIWLVAQSNVAVKNIAEKLAAVNFLNFKILVSKDFHFEWHEHLYEEIERNVIRSDDFADNRVGMERLLLDSRVILCTLSMISHHRMSIFSKIVPVATVVVDEASQIEIGDYLPLLSKYAQNINKLVFIGDNKQLAPYGQDDIGNLRSIFELSHLSENAIFLDTQYRMPIPIGNFISEQVYQGRLKSQHTIQSRCSCVLIDVSHGREQKSGSSWNNIEEANAIVAIVKTYYAQGKSFKVITPYDAQRNVLERRLKSADLPWENKCFNVDSFQGNEEDHIIISVVRSNKVGFLKNLRRTNVMLSRCKKSMVICSSKAFLTNVASDTLLGKLAEQWGDEAWLTFRDVLTRSDIFA